MNKVAKILIFAALVILAAIAFFYPKDAGGTTCGFCGPYQDGAIYKIEYACLGFKVEGKPFGEPYAMDEAGDITCYGIVLPAKTCYTNNYSNDTKIWQFTAASCSNPIGG
jgi:hypothetical protein